LAALGNRVEREKAPRTGRRQDHWRSGLSKCGRPAHRKGAPRILSAGGDLWVERLAQQECEGLHLGDIPKQEMIEDVPARLCEQQHHIETKVGGRAMSQIRAQMSRRLSKALHLLRSYPLRHWGTRSAPSLGKDAYALTAEFPRTSARGRSKTGTARSPTHHRRLAESRCTWSS
jgi:hypothetical protein